jgi:hypothetical protein
MAEPTPECDCAARDMLAALQSILTWYGEPPHTAAPCILKARAAVAKATIAPPDRSAPTKSQELQERIVIGEIQTAIFTLPNGVKLSVSIDDGGLFVHAGSDNSQLRAGIRFNRNCENEGWIEAKILPPIKPAQLREFP